MTVVVVVVVSVVVVADKCNAAIVNFILLVQVVLIFLNLWLLSGQASGPQSFCPVEQPMVTAGKEATVAMFWMLWQR